MSGTPSESVNSKIS